MAEDFGAMPTSPQLACFGWSTSLGFIRSALREKYGAVQASGYSATHEEFLEAKDKKEILAFVQEGLSREAKQSKFLNEVQAWNTGLFRAGFQAADELREKLTRALHDYTVKNLAGPIDPNETVARATRAIPSDERGSFRMGSLLFLSFAGAPLQNVLRPTEIEHAELRKKILKEALFGSNAIFTTGEPNTERLDGHALIIDQGDSKASISLNEQCDILLAVPFERNERGLSFPAVDARPAYS